MSRKSRDTILREKELLRAKRKLYREHPELKPKRWVVRSYWCNECFTYHNVRLCPLIVAFNREQRLIMKPWLPTKPAKNITLPTIKFSLKALRKLAWVNINFTDKPSIRSQVNL
jgi:hypothetical protein